MSLGLILSDDTTLNSQAVFVLTLTCFSFLQEATVPSALLGFSTIVLSAMIFSVQLALSQLQKFVRPYQNNTSNCLLITLVSTKVDSVLQHIVFFKSLYGSSILAFFEDSKPPSLLSSLRYSVWIAMTYPQSNKTVHQPSITSHLTLC